MVANGEASPEDIDQALRFGPAARMAVQGQCMAFHVACGEGGMAKNLDQFGPALKLPWTKLKAPKLTKKLSDRIIKGTQSQARGKSVANLADIRDDYLVNLQILRNRYLKKIRN